jgi:L-iditol 2-dehydrogenase
VQISIAATGICGSDLHIFHSDIALAMRPPVITGHEFSGVVSKIGEGVENVKVGDRVSAITSFKTCGICINCKSGKTNICQHKKLIGYWYDGAFANYIVIPEANVQILPDNVSFHEGAVLEPLCCAIEATTSLQSQAGGHCRCNGARANWATNGSISATLWRKGNSNRNE